MKNNKLFVLSMVLSIVGILILILVSIFKPTHAEWILASLSLLVVSLVMIVKKGYNRSRPIAVFGLIVLFIIFFEIWGYTQILLFNYMIISK